MKRDHVINRFVGLDFLDGWVTRFMRSTRSCQSSQTRHLRSRYSQANDRSCCLNWLNEGGHAISLQTVVFVPVPNRQLPPQPPVDRHDSPQGSWYMPPERTIIEVSFISVCILWYIGLWWEGKMGFSEWRAHEGYVPPEITWRDKVRSLCSGRTLDK